MEIDQLFIELLQQEMQAIINVKYIQLLFSMKDSIIIEMQERIIVSCVEEG
jgi:hypothetical protein